MRIKVTQDDIDRGECNEPTTCAVVRAIKRDAKVPNVSLASEIIIWDQNGDVTCQVPTPILVCAWVRNFDQDKSRSRPFEFDLELEPQNPRATEERA